MRVEHWGLVDYKIAWDRQLECVASVQETGTDVLVFLEHPPVLTLGANFHDSNLLLSEPDYERQGIQVVRTDRGGDVTYHGPGQLVIYPIFDLSRRGRDLHAWLRSLEEVIMDACLSLRIETRRFPPHTGVWVGDKKVAAIGIKVKRWVSMHGIALNCNNDLTPFGSIIPCGIEGYGVTSLSAILGRDVSVGEAQPLVEAGFRRLFG